MQRYEGKLIKTGEPEVYYVYGQKRHWVPSMNVFNRLFNGWHNVTDVSKNMMDSIDMGKSLEEDSKLIMIKETEQWFLISSDNSYELNSEYLDSVGFNNPEIIGIEKAMEMFFRKQKENDYE